MKKGTLIRNIIISAFVIELCIGAFILSFISNLNMRPTSDVTIVCKSIVWGCRTVIYNGEAHTMYETYGIASSGMAALPAAGLFMILFASIACVLVTWFLKKPFAKWILLGLGLIILGGAIMQFFTYQAFIKSLVTNLAKANGITDKETINHYINAYRRMFDDYNSSAPMAVVTGVFGILGAIGVAIPKMIPEKN